MINILWDSSHLWGYLVINALNNLEIPYALLNAGTITKKALTSKQLLLVPGGSARYKAKALNHSGSKLIQDYVQEGGFYLGFCGGAGLALSTPTGLGLCPWGRSKLENRLQHLISGHIFCNIYPSLYTQEAKYSLPIWWASSFKEEENSQDIQVLARYAYPDDDFYIGELKFNLFPNYILEDWQNIYGLNIKPRIFNNQPVMINGKCGKGEYLLSYSHLESPNSQAANKLFTQFLSKALKTQLAKNSVPELNIKQLNIRWQNQKLIQTWYELEKLINLGKELDLIFERNSWLLAWKNALSGSQLNNLRFALYFLLNSEPSNLQIQKWNEYEEVFTQKAKLFFEAATNYFYARRLADSLTSLGEQFLPNNILLEQRNNILGQAMENDGLCGDLVNILELIFTSVTLDPTI